METPILDFQAREVGAMLRRRRNGNRVTLADVAGATGLSVSYLSDLERGLRLPSIPALQKICAALGVSVEVHSSQVVVHTHDGPIDELAACPFCGSAHAPRLRELPASPSPRYVVVCHNCSARGPGKELSELAISSWNKRAERTA